MLLHEIQSRHVDQRIVRRKHDMVGGYGAAVRARHVPAHVRHERVLVHVDGRHEPEQPEQQLQRVELRHAVLAGGGVEYEP